MTNLGGARVAIELDIDGAAQRNSARDRDRAERTLSTAQSALINGEE